MVGQLSGQAALEDGLDQLGQEPARAGQLDPAELGAVDQLIQPGVVGQLLTQLPPAHPPRRTPVRLLLVGHGHSELPTGAAAPGRTTSSYTDHLTGPLDRSHTGIAGERRGGGKAAGPPDSTEQPSGHHRPDAIDLQKPTSDVGDRVGDLAGEGLQPPVGVPDLGDELAGELLAHRLDRARGANGVQQSGRDRRGQVGGRPAGHQVAQQRMQLVDQPGALRDQVVATLIEQRQQRRHFLGLDELRVSGERSDTGRRGRVDDVVLRLPPRESSRTRAVAVEGTSSTRSPRAISHCARWRPRPRAFSTAQRRDSKACAQRSNRR
jgi:hypothetical protein